MLKHCAPDTVKDIDKSGVLKAPRSKRRKEPAGMRRGRVIMSRVCGDKQSVAERASAHRIRVRDLAAIHVSLTCVYLCFVRGKTHGEMRSRAYRGIRGRLVIPTGIIAFSG